MSPAPPLGVEPPKTRPEWEREADEYIAARNGEFELTLKSGAKLRVTANPKPASDGVEITVADFKRLFRITALMNGRVVHVMTKEEGDKEIQSKIDKGLGFWANPYCFVEIDPEKKMAITTSKTASDGVVAAPIPPTEYPVVDPNQWLVISAAIIREQIPMWSGRKVLGTLLRTTNGALFARNVHETDHRLHIQADWAISGGYTIDKEIFEKYMSDSSTVIKVIRGSTIYLTTSEHVKRHGGVIRSWGIEKIVMPLRGQYWLVVDSKGEVIE